MSPNAVLGLRVKSGWAAAVLVGGTRAAPRLLHHSRIELCDPKVPQSRQPYHKGFGSLQKSAAVLRRLTGVVDRATERSMAALVQELRTHRCAARAVVLVVGSTIEPESIGNEHIRAHAYEGRLFRTTLERAARRRRLPCRVVRERGLATAVAGELGVTAPDVRRAVGAIGAEAGRPWRAEEKAAAVAAWMVLGSSARTGRRYT